VEAWLDMFAEAGLLSRPAQGTAGKTADQNKSSVRLVDGGTHTQSRPPPDNVTFQLGRWMARHLHVPQLLAWVLRNGGHLHPFLRDDVHRNLARPGANIPARLRRLWTILADSDAIDVTRFLWTSNQIATATSESERRRLEEQVITSIAPRLVVRPGPSLHLNFRQYLDKKTRGISPMEACGHLELSVGDTDQRHPIQPILDDVSVLGRNAEALTICLEHALTLLADEDSPDRYSSSYRPSIAAHAQNEHHDDWTHLIDLARDSYFALVSSDPARAGNLLERWALSRHPLFKRLALHALTDNPRSDIRLAKRLLVAGRKSGLWEIELRREVLRFLRLAGSRLPRELRTDIVRAIHAGPKSRPKKPPADHAAIIRREKALRLYKLVQGGVTLDKKSKALADEGKPPVEDISEERDEFLSWRGEVRRVAPDELAPQELLTGSIGHVVAALSRDQIDVRQFEGLTLQQPVKCASAIRRLAKRQEWPEVIWKRFLWSIARLRRQQKISNRLENYVARVLSDAPDDLFAGLASAAADVVKDLAETLGIDRDTSLRTLWNKAWTGVGHDKRGGSDDPVSDALNHPAGALAEAALIRLWKYEPKANGGLPEPVRSYFDTVATDPDGHLGRVMLAANLNRLFTIDPKWTGEHLIPLFSPAGSDEAQDLWSGFAWSPTVGPNLFAAFKGPFLEALTSYERLRRRDENLVRRFVAICLDAPHELTAEEIHRVVDSLPETALETSLDMFASRIAGDPDERKRAWNDEVEPWLEDYWPRAGAHNTARTSKKMLRLIVECGSAFPDAVAWSLPHLRPIEGHGLYRLETGDHVARHPHAVLSLLKGVVREDILPSYDRNTLRRILDSLREAAPPLDADPDFQALYRIATL
jgi:hypothetical protein